MDGATILSAYRVHGDGKARAVGHSRLHFVRPDDREDEEAVGRGDLMARGAAIQAYYSSRVRSHSSNRMQVRVSKTPSAAAMVGISHHSAMPEEAKCPHAVFHP